VILEWNSPLARLADATAEGPLTFTVHSMWCISLLWGPDIVNDVTKYVTRRIFITNGWYYSAWL